MTATRHNSLIAAAMVCAAAFVCPTKTFGTSLFPDQVTVFGKELQKLGEYRYTYRFFFDLYEVALFVEPSAGANDVLSATSAFHLRFNYLRKIDKSIILQSADKMLERNLSPEERAQIAERVETLNQAYRTVDEGDSSSLTYRPEVGTTLTINGSPKVTIEGKNFAKLYFTIWLGQEAISTSLKQNLLGEK